MTKLQEFQSTNNVSLFINDEASQAIQSYLNTMKTKSQKTYDNYKGRFNDYFSVITGKDLNTITWDDIKSITYGNAAAYQQYLINKGNKNISINQKLGAINALFSHLATKYPQHNINPGAIAVVELPVSQHNSNSHGILDKDEVYALFNYCDTHDYKPKSQRLFFETLFITALRLDAILTLSTKNIHHVTDNKTKSKVYVIKVVDKAKDRTVAISDSLAERLLAEPVNNDNPAHKDDPTRIFGFSEKALTRTLRMFCESHGIGAERNIVIHSIKKATCNFALEATNGNIAEVAKYLGHNNPATTMKHYADMTTGYSNQLSMTLHEEDNGIEKLQDLTKEELLSLIEKSGIGTVKKLIGLMENGK